MAKQSGAPMARSRVPIRFLLKALVVAFLIDESSHSVASARGAAPEEVYVSDKSVSGYPNPFNSNLTVRVDGDENETYTLNVISAKGEKISQTLNLKCNKDYMIGDNWRSGMYVLQIAQNNKLTTKKVIKLND
jgi:hypothetical protein